MNSFRIGIIFFLLALPFAGPPAGSTAQEGAAASYDWMAAGKQAKAQFGYYVGAAGDVNGDGYSDVIVGAPYFDNGQADEGRAFVYYGSSTGLYPMESWTAEINQAGARFGISVSSAGDVNGDGYSDVIVGAERYDHGETDEGGAFLYYGSASGLKTSPGWSDESDQANAWFGIDVSAAGDVNGDGYGDVLVGASGYNHNYSEGGAVFLYYGSASGLSTEYAWSVESDQANTWMGRVSAGDVNGDGYSDVIVGAFGYDVNGQPDAGRVTAYYGSASGPGRDADWTMPGTQQEARFGASVGAGDVNGDGYADVIVGAYWSPWYDSGHPTIGYANLYYGSASGLSQNIGWTGKNGQAGDRFGRSVSFAGDTNGDGYGDLFVGAYQSDNGQTNEGQSFLYSGSAVKLNDAAAWMAESNQAEAAFGFSVSAAGDVNGDGFGDVIAGAPLFDKGQADEGGVFLYYGASRGLGSSPIWEDESNQENAEFGYSVSTAGDVNGDGYGDVLVGARQFSNGQDNEGRVFLYNGSASGLSDSYGWMAESNQMFAFFGHSVSAAGDVNGDGYGDIIVGAPEYDSVHCLGAALVYYGSAAGLNPSHAYDWIVLGDDT